MYQKKYNGDQYIPGKLSLPKMVTPFFILAMFLYGSAAFSQAIYKEGDLIKTNPYSYPGVDPTLKATLQSIKNQNTTPAQELGYWQRAQPVINFYRPLGGGPFFENEKGWYPHKMFKLLYGIANQIPGDISEAKGALQTNDIYSWAGHTDYIDLFPNFTLNGQIPKYFFFGKHAGVLDADYMTRMFNAADLWSTIDPNGRPHPEFKPAQAFQCFTPECINSWVDTRNTDNMKTMRETSVYLFAEETGNTAVMNSYKTKLRDHVAALYYIGQSEWDSEGYLDYSITPFLNLFEYARDPEVKKYAKAALDWIYIGAASRYYRGLYAGPSKRAYGGQNVVFTGQASFLHLMFGQTPTAANKFARQGLWQLVSGYRPPQVAYELAQKGFQQNTEQLNTKPPYATFSPGAADKPETFETMYYGNTYHYGSVVSAGSNGDVRPFKMVAYNSARGSDVFFVSTTNNNAPAYTKLGGDQMGQYKNLFAWVRPNGNYSYSFMVPNTAILEQDAGIWFFKYEKTWIAIRPINLNFPVANALTGEEVNETNFVAAPTSSSGITGFAMEIGEENISSYADFKTAIKSKTLDLSQLVTTKTLTLNGTDGSFLKMTYNTANDFPILYRNSATPYDWSNAGNYGVYHSATPPTSVLNSAVASGANVTLNVSATDLSRGVISQGWKQGSLSVVTDNWVFNQTMLADGTVTWSEEPKTPANSKGKIAKVEFYALGEKIGEVLNPATDQFNFVWNNAFNGTYAITAKAIDAEGNAQLSNPIQVTVTGGTNPPVVGTGTGLSGKYYNDLFFSGTMVERIDPTVNYDWGSGSPASGISAGTYCVQWNGSVQAKYSGTYTFYTVADDGIRLWVNGNQLVDNWNDQAPTERSGTINLVAGQKYAIQIQYYNNSYGGVAKLYWSHPQQPKEIVPQQFLYPVTPVVDPDGTGLAAVYYDNIDFTGTQLSRTDATVNFNWGSGSPGPSIGSDTFSARWTGEVKANFTETYTFYTRSDDGVRLWVNGVQLVNNWTDHGPTENSGTIALAAGQKYSIVMEYYERGGGAVAELRWSSASTAKSIIPAVNLYPPTTSSSSAGRVAQPAVVENESEGVLIYPNPVRETLTIKLVAAEREEVQVNLVSTIGTSKIGLRQVLDKGSNTMNIRVDGIEEGLYVLRIQRTNGRMVVKKVIVGSFAK